MCSCDCFRDRPAAQPPFAASQQPPSCSPCRPRRTRTRRPPRRAPAEAVAFPLTTRIHGGPPSYAAGGGYGTWYLELTNTTDRPCTGIHPVVVLVDEKRQLKPSQPLLEFSNGSAQLAAGARPLRGHRPGRAGRCLRGRACRLHGRPGGDPQRQGPPRRHLRRRGRPGHRHRGGRPAPGRRRRLGRAVERLPLRHRHGRPGPPHRHQRYRHRHRYRHRCRHRHRQRHGHRYRQWHRHRHRHQNQPHPQYRHQRRPRGARDRGRGDRDASPGRGAPRRDGQPVPFRAFPGELAATGLSPLARGVLAATALLLLSGAVLLGNRRRR
ncbi:hypothetical protein SGLAM104S_00289 [Streptomyces glaucescens]